MESFKDSVDRQLAELHRNILEEHELAMQNLKSTYERRLQRQSADLATIRQSLRDQDVKLQELYAAHSNAQSTPRMPFAAKATSDRDHGFNDEVPDESLDPAASQIPKTASPSKTAAGLELENVSITTKTDGTSGWLDLNEVSPTQLSPRGGPAVSKPLAMSQADEAIEVIREETELSGLEGDNVDHVAGGESADLVGEDYEDLNPMPGASEEGEGEDHQQDSKASVPRGALARAMLARKNAGEGKTSPKQSPRFSADNEIEKKSSVVSLDEKENRDSKTSNEDGERGSRQTPQRSADSQVSSNKRRSMASSIISFAFPGKYSLTRKSSMGSSMSDSSEKRDRSKERVTWGAVESSEAASSDSAEPTSEVPRRPGQKFRSKGGAGRGRATARLNFSMRDRCHMFELKDVWIDALNDNSIAQSASNLGEFGPPPPSQTLALTRSHAQRLSLSERQSITVYRQKELTDYSDVLLQKLVMHPHKRARATWSLFGILLVMWDIITVPLLVFEIPPLPVWAMLLMTLYWTIDVYMSFFTGFETNGQIEMRPRKTASFYAKSWLILDVFTIVPEWFVIFYDIANPSAVASLGDTFRLTRIFRCARLLRVLKMRHFIEKLQDRLNSEYSRAFFGIMKQIVYIVIGDHFLACGWYAIGRWEKPHGWVHQESPLGGIPYIEMSLSYRYLISLHWSLSQIHGTMEVHPYTALERLFATVVLVFALLCASWIVSSVTNMMIQVQQVKEVSIRDKATLRRFLTEHNVSMSLSNSIRNYADECLDRQRAKTREVNVLGQLPPVLRIDLELEIHSKTLLSHGLFHAYCKSHLQAMRSLCNAAIETLVFFQGNQLFSEGQMGTSMYFVIDGCLAYTWREEEHLVADHEYVSEGVLWVDWVHCGEMRAAGMCNNVLAVNAEKFNEIATGHRRTRNFTAAYAEGYLEKLNEMLADEINDLVKP